MKKYSDTTYTKQTQTVDDIIATTNKLTQNAHRNISREIDGKIKILTTNHIRNIDHKFQKKKFLATR